LKNRAIKLKSRLPAEDFVRHPDVKLLKAIDSGMREKISLDPFASHFALRKPLQKYGRLKKMGLPQRYRLFFRAFADQKVIIILWLGFPRKEGDSQDCYAVFSRIVANGKLPESWQRFIHYTSGLMAIILTKQGEFTRAERRLMTVLKYTGKYGDARAGTLCLKHLAEVKKAKGDLVATRAFAERAKSGFKRLRMSREFNAMEQFLQALDV
jgi:toxin YhaV